MPPPAARIAAFAVLTLLATACARPDAPRDPGDPFEMQNRKVHAFNKGVDRALFRPASQVYGGGVPKPVRAGVTNFAENLSTPGYVVNDILQGEAEDAGHNFFRFVLNSTLGVVGIFDPATSFGLAERESDFGQTLHVWGSGEGAYLELPLIGPSTQRDFAGTIMDVVLNPLRHAMPDESGRVVTVARVGSGLGKRDRYAGVIDSVLYESADSYLQAREAYLQNRRFELGGAQSEDYFNPYDDLYAE